MKLIWLGLVNYAMKLCIETGLKFLVQWLAGSLSTWAGGRQATAGRICSRSNVTAPFNAPAVTQYN